MDDDMREVLETFFLEVTEQIQAANDSILLYEKASEAEQIDSLFRALHTIKGNSMMLGFEKMGAIAHAAENVIAKLRNGSLAPSKQLMDLLLAVLDIIAELAEAAHHNTEEPSNVDKFMSLLDAVAQGTTSPQNAVLHDAPLIHTGQSTKVEGSGPPIGGPSEGGLPESTPQNAVSPRHQFSMLIVDDDFVSRKILSNIVRRFGTCDIAGDGTEAIAAFSAAIHDAPYDFVFLDIMLPGTDGFEVAKQIRAIEMADAMEKIRQSGKINRQFQRHDTIIVMTSSLNDPDSYFKACYRCGANTYIVKPVDKEIIDTLFIDYARAN